MSTVPANPSPYLRTTRNFPTDPQELSVEISKSYLDIANRMNDRTIGIFSKLPIITGNAWYVQGGQQKQQTIRQVFTFTGAGSIPHNLIIENIGGFVSIYGTFTDNADPTASNWYPLPYVDVVSAANQVSVMITQTDIVIAAGGGAPPAIVKGFVVIEWLVQV